jgi:hypothetical protein
VRPVLIKALENSCTTFAVSCVICPCLFLSNFLIWNFLFQADGDGAVEFSLLDRFHGLMASVRER